MLRIVTAVLGLAVLTAPMSEAWGMETVTYTYDAKGRLIKVVKAGGANNGVNIEYTHDKAQNRTRVKVTGAL